jgi:alkylation response protein AidB-like acyl-CoA dehydrogenase
MAAALREGIEALRPLAGREHFDPAVPAALVRSGLPAAPLPLAVGGLGAGLSEAVSILAALGAVDASAALGLAMHFHTLGSAVAAREWPEHLLLKVFQAVLSEGALINVAATEEMGGSPARGGIPGTTAVRAGAGFVMNGEKNWTTWLPALRYAVVTARIIESERAGAPPCGSSAAIGSLLLDLNSPGVERAATFDALGVRASASGVLTLRDVRVPADHLISIRQNSERSPSRASALAWFGSCVAAVYLGVGEGARDCVVRWAIDRKPGGSSVADLPVIRTRLGRLDAELRAARVLLLDVARRWDDSPPEEQAKLLPDISLGKLKATQAAVYATDEALRIAGGPGFLRGNLERAFRDARAGLIHPPLEDIVYQDFARLLVEQAGGESNDGSAS